MEEVGRILPSILKRQVERRDPPVVEILGPLWPRVAGKTMAECCRPVAFEAGTLTLATEYAAWSTQLRHLAEEIRAEVNSFLGAPVVQRLRIRRVLHLDAALGQAAAKSPSATPPETAGDGARDPGSPLARTLARSQVRKMAHREKREH